MLATLSRQPPRSGALLHLATDMLAAGRLLAARVSTDALRPLIGDQLEFAELEVGLLLSEGRPDEAARCLDGAIGRMPEAAALRVCRAEARLRAGDAAGAASEAAEAITLDPRHIGAKALLGLALIEVGWLRDAASCLREAVRAAPGHPQYRLALAHALERDDRGDDAVAVLEQGFAHAPGEPTLRIAAITAEMRRRRFDRAEALASAARGDGIADACVFGLLGHALSSLGRHEDAAEAYAEALKLAPEDPYVRHLVTASGILPSASRAPAEYVETVFDGYADRFDEHLVSLGYRVPGLLRARLLAARPGGAFGPVLDLGCGTGFMGVVLSDLALDALVGVDLSTRMLERAEARGLYSELRHGDIERFLAEDQRIWPVIVAADVLCYLGALDGLFASIRERLDPAGLFLFTVEEATPDETASDWSLLRLGRYVHTEAYIRRCAAENGLAVRAIEREAVRLESGSPVAGLVVSLGRAALDG